MEECYKHNGFLPYPVFELLDTVPRMGLFGFAALLMTVSTVGLKWVYEKINGKIMEVLQEEQNKKKSK